jgi:hypothetical protein
MIQDTRYRMHVKDAFPCTLYPVFLTLYPEPRFFPPLFSIDTSTAAAYDFFKIFP